MGMDAVAVPRTAPPSEDLPCVRRPVLRTASPLENLPCVRRPVSRTTSPSEDLPCARRPVPRTAPPPEDLPCARRPVSRTAHPPEDLPCARRPVSRTAHPPEDLPCVSSGISYRCRNRFPNARLHGYPTGTCSPSSTRTRIKTSGIIWVEGLLPSPTQNPSSTRTRIKTSRKTEIKTTWKVSFWPSTLIGQSSPSQRTVLYECYRRHIT